ncbi:MAG: hypothetical protein ACRC63_00795, partial [Metamycoplasmataceae bacterium]
LSSVFAERPDFVLDTSIISPEQLSQIFGNKSANDLAHWSIYVIGICGGLIPFFILEIEKEIEHRLFKAKNEEIITSFKLIEKPIRKHNRKKINDNVVSQNSFIKMTKNDLDINNYLSNN